MDEDGNDDESGDGANPPRQDDGPDLNQDELARVINVPNVSGYSIVFDNVNKHVKARSTDREHGNVMKNMVQAYAVVNRISALDKSDTLPTVEEIQQIPVEVYVVDDEYKQILRNDFEFEVRNILMSHLDIFQDVPQVESDCHQYEMQSCRKSKLIPLGVLDKDECKIGDMVDVFEVYHKYVPGTPEHPFVIPLYGDQLSVERAFDAQNTRVNAGLPTTQLQGLHPSIQEWHKRTIILEDTYKLLYSQKSARSVGSLCHIRNTYRHNNVKADVHQCFNEATDLLRFATISYVIAVALSYMKCDSITDKPEDLPVDIDERAIYLKDIASNVVNMCFNPPNAQPVISANAGQETYRYCVCKTDTGDVVVGCDNPKCKNGKWFHLKCMDLDQSDVDELDSWYCCKVCSSQYMQNQHHQTKIQYMNIAKY